MRLDLYLVNSSFCHSRTKSKELIESGKVKVNNKIQTKTSYLIKEDDKITVDSSEQYISRAALKLKYAIDKIADFDICGHICLDIGASTGGFTQILLLNDAKKVYSLDVGHNQLHKKIRNDKKVINQEGCNIRDLDPKQYEDVTRIVCDVSFISLSFVIDKIKMLKSYKAILLIKPQFEIGKDLLKKCSNGVIVDEELQKYAVDKIVKYCLNAHLEVKKVFKAEITGKNGNQEYILYLSK